jgi:hypothetical protein
MRRPPSNLEFEPTRPTRWFTLSIGSQSKAGKVKIRTYTVEDRVCGIPVAHTETAWRGGCCRATVDLTHSEGCPRCPGAPVWTDYAVGLAPEAYRCTYWSQGPIVLRDALQTIYAGAGRFVFVDNYQENKQ